MTLLPRTPSNGLNARVSRRTVRDALAGICNCSLTISNGNVPQELTGWRDQYRKALWPRQLERSQSPRAIARGAD